MNYHDKKTAHTSPQNYEDLEGNMRTFTVVDHDKHTKISVPSSLGNPTEEMEKSRLAIVDKILTVPAVYCNALFFEFTNRGQSATTVTWNEEMLRDKGVPFNQLLDIYTLSSNAMNMRT